MNFVKTPIPFSDSGANVRDDYINELVVEIEKTIGSRRSFDLWEVPFVMAYFEILCGVSLYCGQNQFSPADVDGWERFVIEIFDREGDFKEPWRPKVMEVFAQLRDISINW